MDFNMKERMLNGKPFLSFEKELTEERQQQQRLQYLYDELSYKKAIIAIKKPTNKNISNSKYFDFYKYVKTVLKKNIKIKKYKDNYNITENIILIKKNPKKFRIKNIKYIARGNYASYTTPVYRIGNIYFSK